MTATPHLEDLARQLLRKPSHALEPEERTVLAGIHAGLPISRDSADVSDAKASVGDRLADRVAAVGGSWGFIIVFVIVLVGWMVLNSDVLGRVGLAFDPYPFIFLNLVLSTVAAIQAPIIMMSQNRQAAKDRIAASLDFEVNLRAELEIMRLHEKIDLAILQRLDLILAQLEITPPPTEGRGRPAMPDPEAG